MGSNFFSNNSIENAMPEVSICMHQIGAVYHPDSDNCTLMLLTADFNVKYTQTFNFYARWIRVGFFIKESKIINTEAFKISYEVLYDYFDETEGVVAEWFGMVLFTVVIMIMFIASIRRLFRSLARMYFPRQFINFSYVNGELQPENHEERLGRILERGYLKKEKYLGANAIKYEQTECTFCLEVFEENDEIGSLTCCHIFHYTCILKWNEFEHRALKCPVCCRPLDEAMANSFVTNNQSNASNLTAL